MFIQMKAAKQEMAGWILEIEVSICGLAFYREVGTIQRGQDGAPGIC